MNTQEQIERNLAGVRAQLDAAGATGTGITLVTKGFGPEAIAAAIAAEQFDIGENYVQELTGKLDEFDHVPGLRVRMIGQLQTNKVRQLAGRVYRYDTVDRLKLAREIAKRDPGARILIQVDTTDEPGKGGIPIGELDQLVDDIAALDLQLDGLMTVGPTEGGPDMARPGFRAVRAATDRLGLSVCSMGMSADLAVAADEGATEVRIGSAIFGSRPVRATR